MGPGRFGAALAVLQGRLPEAKLFHQTEHANSVFELVLRNEPDRAPLLMSLSRQDTVAKSLRKVTIPVSHAEASVLETALKKCRHQPSRMVKMGTRQRHQKRLALRSGKAGSSSNEGFGFRHHIEAGADLSEHLPPIGRGHKPQEEEPTIGLEPMTCRLQIERLTPQTP